MAAEEPFIRRPSLYPAGFRDAELPFGLRVDEVRDALEQVYEFLHDLNTFMVSKGYGRLEEMILGNTLSGFISEMVVKNLGAASKSLARNTKVGGHPDLIPRGRYPDDSVLRAEDGIEVKTSVQSGGWQGHNPERSWILVVQYSVDVITQPIEERRPVEVLKVMCGLLEESDWSFSGRSGASRRTPTASILQSGTLKLHQNYIYEHPHYVRNLKQMAEMLKALHMHPSMFESAPLKEVSDAEVEAEVDELVLDQHDLDDS